jgi:hypothetical protein
VSRALIVTAQIDLVVKEVDAAAARVRAGAEAAGGYVSNESTSGSGDGRVSHLELRVPTDRVKDVRGALAELGEVRSQSETVEDVSEQRADLKARLHNARVQEARVLAIMEQKTGAIAEVVEAEKELARVRDGIERMEAQERSMEGKIALATIKVSLSPHFTPTPVADDTFGTKMDRAGSGGMHAAGALLTGICMALVASAPILLPLATIGFGILFFLRARRRRRAAAARAIG